MTSTANFHRKSNGTAYFSIFFYFFSENFHKIENKYVKNSNSTQSTAPCPALTHRMRCTVSAEYISLIKLTPPGVSYAGKKAIISGFGKVDDYRK